MGDQNVSALNRNSRAAFTRALLDDLEALEKMLAEGLIEDDIQRIGAEQEGCLVNTRWRPAPHSDLLLESIDDPHFTTELARYNFEINLDPLELKGDCFRRTEARLQSYLDRCTQLLEGHEIKPLLTGILPTIAKTDLRMECMTPSPRYWALNDILRSLRGSDFSLHMRGTDELNVVHDSILFEACNTSFQTHLQIHPQEFVAAYNWAQAIAGPILAMAVNSPLLLGRELWQESRIALFQQSIDLRSSSRALKEQAARVSFGDQWAQGSIADIFQHNLAQFPVIVAKEIEEPALESLKAGKIPKLEALSVYNGTVYQWNRACYGRGGGKAHVRIENRYLPAGPSIADEVANFALWVGLMQARPSKGDSAPQRHDFRQVKNNFIKAARLGKEALLHWEGQLYRPVELMEQKLLPLAEEGLKSGGVNPEDIRRYLGIIADRGRGQNGAEWTLHNYRRLKRRHKTDHALNALTEAMYERQQSGEPVHRWPVINVKHYHAPRARRLGHVMSTQLFTMREEDLAALAIRIMSWKKIHHLPVENQHGELTGLLTWRRLSLLPENSTATAAEIMRPHLITARPEMPLEQAVELMRKNEIGCLPVLQDQHLLGLVTRNDLIPLGYAFDRD